MPKKSTPLQAGQKFGRLTVVKLDHTKKYIHKSGIKEVQEFYLCKCDCGNETVVRKNMLKNGYTLSCGCVNREKAKLFGQTRKTHGFSKSRIYSIWSKIKLRCYNKNDEFHYNLYGKRGITVCDEWKNNFMAFYNWAMANGYKDNLTIDRINANGNYEPSNCRWATIKEQCNNRRTTVIVKYNGLSKSLMEWAEQLNISYSTLRKRFHRGVSLDKLFAKGDSNV